MNPMVRSLVGVAIVCVLTGGRSFAADTNSPEGTVQRYIECLFAADTNGALSLTYVPDQVSPITLKHYSCETRELLVARVIRGTIGTMIDGARFAGPASNASPKVVACCATNGFAAVVVAEQTKGFPREQGHLSTIFLIRTEEGWKLPFDGAPDYSALLSEDRRGEEYLRLLDQWSRKQMADLRKTPSDK